MAVSSQSDSVEIGDPADWVDHYGDMMLHFAYSRVGKRDLAEDLVQETFLAAWKARESFDGRSRLGTWLVGILRRKIADHYRATGRKPETNTGSEELAGNDYFTAKGKWIRGTAKWPAKPDELAENGEFWEVFYGCMSDMPAHLAQAFHLRELGLASMSEICNLVGIKPKNLSVRLHRARLLLRDCLDKKWFRAEPKK